MTVKIPYGLDNQNQLVHIDQVKNGFKCDCICPECGSKLNARNGGESRIHHFAHISSAQCNNAGETILHILAKKILCEASEIQLPSEKHHNTVMQPERTLVIGHAYPEKRVGDFIPDITLVSTNDEDVCIEIKVTHEVDEMKLRKIKNAKINCLEIDLHGYEKRLFDNDFIEKLKNKLLYSPNDYIWLHSKSLQQFIESKHDFKFRVKNKLFDKDTFLQIEFNERLTWKNSLDLIWINNDREPFIAGTWYKDRFYTYYFAEDPKRQKTKYGKVFGYTCDIIGDNSIRVLEEWGQYFFYKCEVVEENKKEIFNPFAKIWYFVQDYPDEIVDEVEFAKRKLARELKLKQEQKEKEYKQELNRRSEQIVTSTKTVQFETFSINPFPRTAGELLKVYGDTTKIMVIKNDTGEVMTVSDALQLSNDYPEIRIKRIWSYFDRVE